MQTVNRYQERSHYSGWGSFSPRAFQRFQRIMLGVGIGALVVALGIAFPLGWGQVWALAACGLLGAMYDVKLIPLS